MRVNHRRMLVVRFICEQMNELQRKERTKLSFRVNNSNANINAAEIVIKLCLDALTVKTILVYVYSEVMWAWIYV
jgi:hypothetical protein